MSRWIQLAKSRFSKAPQESTDETDETPVSRVLSVPLCKESEKSMPSKDEMQPVDEEAIAERAAIMEFDAGLERDLAERMARLHTAYLMHHWRCSVCCAAGHGRGHRCEIGGSLWNDYQASSDEADAARTRRNSK